MKEANLKKKLFGAKNMKKTQPKVDTAPDSTDTPMCPTMCKTRGCRSVLPAAVV